MILISIRDYFGIHQPEHSEHIFNAKRLLSHVHPLLEEATDSGVQLNVNPKTGTLISGEIYGGYRPRSCPIGAAGSAHKQGMAIDIFDFKSHLDDWLTDELLAKFDLYREHPDYTLTWCHLQTRAPGSGNRTFRP